MYILMASNKNVMLFYHSIFQVVNFISIFLTEEDFQLIWQEVYLLSCYR